MALFDQIVNPKLLVQRVTLTANHSQTKYSDIINLPHHVSPSRPQMTITDRAAQFSPFAALTGYDAAIEETRRIHEENYEKRGANSKDFLLKD